MTAGVVCADANFIGSGRAPFPKLALETCGVSGESQYIELLPGLNLHYEISNASTALTVRLLLVNGHVISGG